MSLPDAAAVMAAMAATWPPAASFRQGPWTIRQGLGGGSRVSAASAEAPVAEADIPAAEAAMRALGQRPNFMLRSDEAALDALLAARGYEVLTPVWLYAADCAAVSGEPLPRMRAFAIWPPLAIMCDLWAEGGIGPERIAVMQRAPAPKTAVLIRHEDRPGGTGFVAIHGEIAMIHAIEVTAARRRARVGTDMMRFAAHWALDHGARWIGLAVTRANGPANALYASLGMRIVGDYHYRIEAGQEGRKAP